MGGINNQTSSHGSHTKTTPNSNCTGIDTNNQPSFTNTTGKTTKKPKVRIGFLNTILKPLKWLGGSIAASLGTILIVFLILFCCTNTVQNARICCCFNRTTKLKGEKIYDQMMTEQQQLNKAQLQYQQKYQNQLNNMPTFHIPNTN